jgi:hypothetical protein
MFPTDVEYHFVPLDLVTFFLYAVRIRFNYVVSTLGDTKHDILSSLCQLFKTTIITFRNSFARFRLPYLVRGREFKFFPCKYLP